MIIDISNTECPYCRAVGAIEQEGMEIPALGHTPTFRFSCRNTDCRAMGPRRDTARRAAAAVTAVNKLLAAKATKGKGR